MPCNIYLDTSILGALADPPARSAYARTCQALTRRWFRALPHTRNLCTSTFALDKIKAGAVTLASARLRVAEQLHVLSTEAIFTTETELFLAGGVTWDWQQLEARRLPFLHLMLDQAGLSQMDFISPLQLVKNDYETLQTSKGR